MTIKYKVRLVKSILYLKEEEETPKESRHVIFCEIELPFVPFPKLVINSETIGDIGWIEDVHWDHDKECFLCRTNADEIVDSYDLRTTSSAAQWYIDRGWNWLL